ncbi:hypothetical protein [Fodinibius halophilus]|uniref:Uncharacterized protein n=1 Tax=Fodinibius halophilus TaxID=1736908 RepID=A0A6M1T3A9_9BACT|nr:hypothetical protein [Fodinibius halophilus]NGP88567.1 hypothetical protein [Fodinibius halophilus]
MKGRSILFTTVIFCASLLLLNCSKSDDQRDFESEAFTTPDGITHTNTSGKVVGNVDNDDWNISPMYRGLLQVKSNITDYPHPNPLGYNEDLTLQVKSNVSDAVEGMKIYKFRFPKNANSFLIKELNDTDLGSAITTITIDGALIAENSSADARTTYRILIYDNKENLISYGDIRIE